ncbi:hypothetical protein ACFL6L_03970 [candidate division KSB1 bacterium]
MLALTITGSMPWLVNFLDLGYILPFNYFLCFHLLIGAASFFYSWYLRLWKRDVVFAFMEPILFIGLMGYSYFNFHMDKIFILIYNWISLYLVIQLVLLTAKVAAGLRLSHAYFDWKMKFRYLIWSFPRIKASFSLNDLSLLGVDHVINPSKPDYLLKELEFTKRKVIALSENNPYFYESIIREEKEFQEKFRKSRLFQRMFKKAM